jgi:MYXO-CTERM domain-containing protein
VEAPAPLPTPHSPSPPPSAPPLEARNLFGEAERIAARAASPSTRRQYGAIFRAFGDWLAGELGRPPVVGDLDADGSSPTAGTWLRLVGAAAARRRRRPCACTCR